MKKTFSFNYTVNLADIPQIAFSILQVGCRDLDKFESTTVHSHNFFELFYVSRGEVRLKIHDKTAKLGRGTIIAIAPGDVHSFQAVKSSLICFINYTILFRRKLLFKTHKSIKGLTAAVSVIAGTRKDLTPYFTRLLRKSSNPEERLCRKAIANLLELINRILEKRSHLPGIDTQDFKHGGAIYVVKGMAYMKKNILENISIREVCRNCVHVSPRHFCRLFKKTVRQTPREFLNCLKIEKAKSMLNKGQPAKVVAQKLGFKDIYSFYRAFHRVTGTGITRYVHKEGALRQRP